MDLHTKQIKATIIFGLDQAHPYKLMVTPWANFKYIITEIPYNLDGT
jgi:hypothetical protein